MSSGNSPINNYIYGANGSSWQFIIAVAASCLGVVVGLINAAIAHFRDKKHEEELAAQERRLEAFKKELEDKQRRLVRFENVRELMKQYKKPLLQSAFDLQSRLFNQVHKNFLFKFDHEDRPERDRKYARLNTVYVIAEFLGWLEVIRQEIVFIVDGGDGTSNLNHIIDAIKYQFTGEDAVQGAPESDLTSTQSAKSVQSSGSEKTMKSFDDPWRIMQLYAGELRAIGEVMITERSYDDDKLGSNLSVIGYAEFVRRQTMKEPADNCSRQEEVATWSKAQKQREIVEPLVTYVERLMKLDNDSTPRLRLAILQVLLCKLIDELDNAVPYDVAPEYDLDKGEEPRYIARDNRLTPLVKYLSRPQLKWLADKPFMQEVKDEELDLEDATYWHQGLKNLSSDPDDIEFPLAYRQRVYRRLAFPGFREDLHRNQDGRLLTQPEREAKLSENGEKILSFPGAFPIRKKRSRKDNKAGHVHGAAHGPGSSRQEAPKQPMKLCFTCLRRRTSAVAPEPQGRDTSGASSQLGVKGELASSRPSGRTDSQSGRQPQDCAIVVNPVNLRP